jgi:hypothetical protein
MTDLPRHTPATEKTPRIETGRAGLDPNQRQTPTITRKAKRQTIRQLWQRKSKTQGNKGETRGRGTEHEDGRSIA